MAQEKAINENGLGFFTEKLRFFWPEYMEEFEERAGIMEYCGGLFREEAEKKSQALIQSKIDIEEANRAIAIKAALEKIRETSKSGSSDRA